MANAKQNITAFNVNGEILSSLQDSPVSSGIATWYGTGLKNAFAGLGILGGIFTGNKPDLSSLGLPFVASAPGTRVEMPAVDLYGNAYGPGARLTNPVSLHLQDYVLSSFKSSLSPNGTLPPEYLRNVY